MGYVLKDIANIIEPARVSLAGIPNFIQIASKTTGGAEFSARLSLMNETIAGAALINSGFYRPDGTTGVNADFSYTDPVDVSGLDFIHIRSQSVFNSVSPAVFFDATMNYISGHTPGNLELNIFKIPVPPDAVFMISSSALSSSSSFFIGLYDIVEFEIVDGHGGTRRVQGTTDPGAVGGSIFFLSPDDFEMSENLKAALLNDPYIGANYSVYSDVDWNDGAPTVDGVLMMALDLGPEFDLDIDPTGGSVVFIAAGAVSDSIRGAEAIVGVFVDLYAVEALDRITTAPPSGVLGEFLVTLSKSYNGVPVWFDLNRIFAQSVEFTPPLLDSPGVWFDPGTLQAFRGLVRKGTFSQTPFFITEILYAISGYGFLEDNREMIQYAYNIAPIHTLTEKPATPYIKGQKEFITFLLAAELEGKTVSVLKRAYNSAGVFLGGATVAAISAESLQAINSIVFTFDDLLEAYPAAVKVTATLALNGALISQPQEYDVRPECLHIQQDFYFLNRLGGWDTFNFDAETVEENSPKNETFERTVTPGFNKAVGVEGIYLADLETVVTVQGVPVNDDVREWLKQLTAAKVVLDSQGRRVIIEDFTARGEMAVPIMKFRYSQTFTNDY